MRSIKTTIFFVAIILFTACKKTDIQSNSKPELCTIQRAPNDGNIIPGQYIVSYKENNKMSMASAQRVTETTRGVLIENSIPSSALKQSFSGGTGGFVARLSEEQAKKLAEDPSVQTVEPDRVVALGSCFTIVAPTLITWNVNKVGYGNGIGKTAWIIDSGIDYGHPDLTVDTIRSRSF